jgi:hypothetical protein
MRVQVQNIGMGEDLPPKTHRSLLSGIATVFKSIDELHLHLAYVKGQWTCPETSVFVRALFEPAARELPFPQAISVVLSDTYMFEETEVLMRGGVSDAAKLNKSLAAVRARVREAPCTIAEIVNAGWLYKCEQIYADAAARIQKFDIDNGMDEEFALKLLNLDNLLRNSIETSYLATLFSPYLRPKGEA